VFIANAPAAVVVPSRTSIKMRAKWVGVLVRGGSYPHCASHINYVREHATTSPCFGAFGREACEGFQLDRADACNVQCACGGWPAGPTRASARAREQLARSCAQRWPHEWSRAHAEGMRLAALASPVNDCACALRADYLFCERLYKPLTAQSWCPPPAGYPRHCCYAQALRGQQHSGLSARRPTRLGATAHERPPGAFLLQVFPEQHDDGAT
jgi:hypothetical protein